MENTFKITLSAARKNTGMTSRQAAKALGITQTTLSKYECGKASPKADLLKKIVVLYKVPIENLDLF